MAGAFTRRWCGGELFVERAASMVSDTLADEASAVEDVCRRLDGIPLAIELAASRMASMTAAEVRDRLDDRFKLLVGSRRGLERHQTLRHAVAWSYDLLDDAEKSVLARCSVFAGGFDLQSACAVAGSDDIDEYAILDLLDALVRKSLLVADRSSGRTRFSMLETIRQFAEEQLVASGEATEVRTAHARYFAGRETDILALWDSPRQREAYTWFAAELANLRTAFRWAADHGDLDTAAAIATCAGFLGFWSRTYEPDRVGRRAHRTRPRRRPSSARGLYTRWQRSALPGRIERLSATATQARWFSSAAARRCRPASRPARHHAYATIGQPERCIEWCRPLLARGAHSVLTGGQRWSWH